jgi:transposase
MSFKIQAIYQADYLNVLSALMKQLNIADKINQLVSFDPQCQTTPGETVHLLLLDILSGRQALVHIEKWAQHIDLEKLLSSDTPAHFFNDDAIGRHLDRLADANIHRVFSELTLHIWKTEQISSAVFHADTTSKSVYGAYVDEDNHFRITEGYSRDRIGDKQFQYGLIVNADGIPIYGDAHDGNLSDKTWNPDVLEKMAEQAKKLDLSSFIYVADSAAMNKKNTASG